MNVSVLVLIVSILLTSRLIAQTDFSNRIDTVPDKGEINIFQDKVLDDMIKHHIILNEESGTIAGYRIQIISSAVRNRVLEVKGEFLQHFITIKTHMIYQQPYFKLRIGDFKTRLEAYKLLIKVREHFHDAFIIRDGIDINNL